MSRDVCEANSVATEGCVELPTPADTKWLTGDRPNYKKTTALFYTLLSFSFFLLYKAGLGVRGLFPGGGLEPGQFVRESQVSF